jgi:hypothetical protein
MIPANVEGIPRPNPIPNAILSALLSPSPTPFSLDLLPVLEGFRTVVAELALVVEAVAGVVGTADDAVDPPSRKIEY